MDILQLINKKTTFNELYKILKCDKRQLGQNLQQLEKQGHLVSFKDNYYKISDYDSLKGWVSPGAKSGMFFTQNAPNLELGSNFFLDDEKNIINKKTLMPNAFVEVCELEPNLVFVKSLLKQNSFEFVGYYSDNKVRGFIKGFDLIFDANVVKNNQQSNNTWGHYFYDENGLELKSVITNSEDKSLYATLSSYILNYNKQEYIDTFIENPQLLYKDLTYLPFYTIDSISTKDIDDAIYYVNNKLYIAIADASSYVNKNLDIKAQQQSSTFYLPNKVEHMLPRQLSESEVSLNPGVTKKAMICEIQFNSNYEIENTQFYLANIKSFARMSYQDVDNVIENKALIESTIVDRQAEIIKSIKALNEVVCKNNEQVDDIFRPQRTEVLLDENGKVQEIVLEPERTASQKIVEYCMVKANTQAAKYIYDNYNTTALFRNQIKQDDKVKSASYNTDSVGHVSLNSDFYTHFTSPIRRYSDLIVHRIIKDILNKTKNHEQIVLEKISNHLNYMGKKMKSVEQKINDLMKNQYIEQLNENYATAFIVDIIPSGVVFRTNKNLDFFVPAFKIEDELFNKIDEFMTKNPNKEIALFQDFLNTLNKDVYEIEIKDLDSVLDKKFIKVKKLLTPSSIYKP